MKSKVISSKYNKSCQKFQKGKLYTFSKTDDEDFLIVLCTENSDSKLAGTCVLNNGVPTDIGLHGEGWSSQFYTLFKGTIELTEN